VLPRVLPRGLCQTKGCASQIRLHGLRFNTIFTRPCTDAGIQVPNSAQVVDKTLWVLKATGDFMLISYKLLAQPRDGRTKNLKIQRIQLRSAIANRITLVLRWHCYASQLAQKGSLMTALRNAHTRLWLGNDWLSQVSESGLEQACEEAMASLLGQATELGVTALEAQTEWRRIHCSLSLMQGTLPSRMLDRMFTLHPHQNVQPLGTTALNTLPPCRITCARCLAMAAARGVTVTDSRSVVKRPGAPAGAG
jgi:hypothetical protein